MKKLISKKGQVFMEGLFFICCLISFIITLNLFQKISKKEINKHRLNKTSKNKSYKGRWYSD